MKKILSFICLSICFNYSFAQYPPKDNTGTVKPKGIGVIKGIVADPANNQPVSYASVALVNLTTGKLQEGTVTNDKGEFELKFIPNGEYKLSISFIGYKTIEKSPVSISEEKPQAYLGSIEMQADDKLLKEVVVEGQKVLIEEKADRTVYNAENDATVKGGDATDVMKRVPMVSVDLDGNVSLRGNQNIKILINNRPSTLSAGSVADALKQIPADLIKSVEVITSPSARYDAEGSAGIININLKKNTLEGLFLNVDASAGFRGSNLGLNGNYNKKKMRFSLGGFGRSGYNIPGSFNNTQITYDANHQPVSTTTQQADTRTEMLFGNYNLGWDYDIDEHNFLTASVRYGVRNNHSYQDKLRTNTSFSDTSLTNKQTIRNVDVSDLSSTIDVSLNYTHTFKKPQHEFSLLTLYSENTRQNNFENDTLNPTDEQTVIGKLINKNPSTNREISFQADYQIPIGKDNLVEVGAKDIIRKVTSDYNYFRVVGASGSEIPLANANLSNTFNYNQNVSAAYLSYTYNFLKVYSLKAGGRYEYTTISANFQNGQAVSIPSYPVFVESFNLSRKFKNGKTLKASFNRRIQRPSIQFLNPNIQASNPLSITIGNPYLQPEYTNNYELAYSTNIKGSFLTFATFMRNTTGSIQSIKDTTATVGVIETTYKNIGKQDAYGANIFANINISNKLSISGGPDLYYAVLNNNLPGDLNFHNHGWVLSGRIFGNYNFSNGWGLQMFAFYRGNQVQLQGYQTGFGIYSLSLKKDFNDKKGSVGFGFENFFTPAITINTYSDSRTISQTSSNTMHNLSFKVNFSYKIGKMSADNSKRKKSINNDDLKEGGDNNPGGGMMQGGGSPGQGGGGQAPAFGPGQKPAQTPGQPGQAPTQTKDQQKPSDSNKKTDDTQKEQPQPKSEEEKKPAPKE